MNRRLLWRLSVAALVTAIGFIWWTLPPPALAAPASPADPRVVRGSIHVHTARSDGSGTIDEVASAAHRAGLQFVVITDHGDGTRSPEPPAYRDGVLCIDGVEISTTGGHYLALGLPRIPYRLAGEPRDVVEDVKRFGGIGIIAHPDSPKPALAWTDWDVPVDGVEWLNADTEWRRRGGNDMARAVATYFLRPPETIAALFGSPGPVFSRWDDSHAIRPCDCDRRARRARAFGNSRGYGHHYGWHGGPSAVVRSRIQESQRVGGAEPFVDWQRSGGRRHGAGRSSARTCLHDD